METVTLKREPFTDTHTFGAIYWDGLKLCDTIEKPWKDNQKRISCIPEGEYTAIQFCSPHHGDVWLLENTTPRSMIEIHPANLAEELEGCIAPGKKGFLGTKPAVLRSKETMAMLKKVLPRKFTLKIINHENS